MSTETTITAQAILDGSDRLHRMTEEVIRIVGILVGALKTLPKVEDDGPVIFAFPQDDLGVYYDLMLYENANYMRWCRDGLQGITEGTPQSTKSFLRSLPARDIALIHSQLDALVEAVLAKYPNCRETLAFLADQALTPDQRMVQ